MGGPHRNGLLMTSGEVRKPLPGAKKPGVSASSSFRISREWFFLLPLPLDRGQFWVRYRRGIKESKVGIRGVKNSLQERRSLHKAKHYKYSDRGKMYFDIN